MQHIANSAIGADVEADVDGYKLIEMIRQEYGENNCVFSAGVIVDHPIEDVYLKWQKDGDEGSMLWLTSDEMAAIAWICSGTLWSVLLNQRTEKLRRIRDEMKQRDNVNTCIGIYGDNWQAYYAAAEVAYFEEMARLPEWAIFVQAIEVVNGSLIIIHREINPVD